MTFENVAPAGYRPDFNPNFNGDGIYPTSFTTTVQEVLPQVYRSNVRDETYGIFNNTVNEFLESAKKSANRILGKELDRGAVPIRTTKKSKSSFVYSPTIVSVGNTTHVHGGNSRGNRGSDAAGRVVVGVIAAIVAFVGSYFVGKSISQINDSNRELGEVKEFKGYIKSQKENYPDNPHISDIDKVRSIKEQIFTRNKTSAIAKLALTVSLVAGAILCVAGAVVASSALMATGGLLSFVSTCGILLRYGLENGSKSNKKDAEKILESVKHLKEADQVILSYRNVQIPVATAPVIE
jgi:hypothetical protein